MVFPRQYLDNGEVTNVEMQVFSRETRSRLSRKWGFKYWHASRLRDIGSGKTTAPLGGAPSYYGRYLQYILAVPPT